MLQPEGPEAPPIGQKGERRSRGDFALSNRPANPNLQKFWRVGKSRGMHIHWQSECNMRDSFYLSLECLLPHRGFLEVIVIIRNEIPSRSFRMQSAPDGSDSRNQSAPDGSNSRNVCRFDDRLQKNGTLCERSKETAEVSGKKSKR